MKAKPQRISILKLYENISVKQWNDYITRCIRQRNVKALEKTLTGLRIDYNQLIAKRLNNSKTDFIAWKLIGSVERALNRIVKGTY